MAIDVLGGFESTYQPADDVDVAETTEHVRRWRQDLRLLRHCGVSRLRYPVRWHRIEASPNTFDWDHTDEVLGHLRDEGMRPIVDLCHHTSYPRWLEQGFVDPQFGRAYLRFLVAFAGRYPWRRVLARRAPRSEAVVDVALVRSGRPRHPGGRVARLPATGAGGGVAAGLAAPDAALGLAGPPAGEIVANVPHYDDQIELRITEAGP